MADWHDGYDGERYTAKLTLMLMPSQMTQLREEADALAIKPLSRYARAKLAGEQVPACDVRVIRQLAYEINAVGNNINQLAKVAHESGRVRLTGELEKLAADLRAALARVIAL